MSEHIDYQDNVFVNCPFDGTYEPLFRAVIFAIQDCGFRVRCAKEEDSTGDVRIQKIIRIIDECRYGIHDISKADLDERSHLARFNMPLELGIFIGAHHFAPPKSYNRSKQYIVLDVDPYRYQQFISDLGGQDIKAYGADPVTQIAEIIRQVRDFLATSSRRNMPGSGYFHERYLSFLAQLPAICISKKLELNKLTYRDHLTCVVGWLSANQE